MHLPVATAPAFMRAFLTALGLAGLLAGCAAPRIEPPAAAVPSATVELRVLAFNDFHGNLKTPSLRVPVPDATASTGFRLEPAGGVEQFAALVKSRRAAARNSVVVSAGDMVGATPLLSAFFHDEPTIEAMNLTGVDIHAVGNHEFDYGIAHLKRLRQGGCPVKNGAPDCGGRPPYAGAAFEFLAANVIEKATGKPLFPPYAIRSFEGIKVAFIGATLTGTPLIVRPGGTAGTDFLDEAEAINRWVPEVRAQGAETIIALVHQGLVPQPGGVDGCALGKDAEQNRIVEIAARLDPLIRVVISGHTHRFHVCNIDGRLITAAGSYGTLVTEIDLTLERASGRIAKTAARNLRVDPAGARDSVLSAHVERYSELAAPMENRVVARMSMELPNIPNAAGESLLGNLVADAHLASAAEPEKGGAVIAFNNPRSLRAPLIPGAEGGIRYGDLFRAQPFQNDLVLMNLSGRQIKAVLEQQFGGAGILNVSKGFAYAWDNARPAGQKIIAESMMLNGAPIVADLQYRVIANAFIAGGSEGMTVFREGTDRQVGVLDLEALVEYLARYSDYRPAPMGRIRRIN